jgi:hypothetical protein
MLAKLFISSFFTLKMAFWNKKKEESKEIKPENYELPELPTITDFSKEKLTQEINLESINMDKSKETGYSELPEIPDIYKPAAVEAKISTPSERNMTSEISSLSAIPKTAPIRVKERMNEEESEGNRIGKIKGPIYIKIDKFKEALTNFDIIRKKLREVESLLKKIKEIRAKEQEEMNEWENELEDIKNKLASIDEKLFSKFD